jgi:hypothetical protein
LDDEFGGEWVGLAHFFEWVFSEQKFQEVIADVIFSLMAENCERNSYRSKLSPGQTESSLYKFLSSCPIPKLNNLKGF